MISQNLIIYISVEFLLVNYLINCNVIVILYMWPEGVLYAMPKAIQSAFAGAGLRAVSHVHECSGCL